MSILAQHGWGKGNMIERGLGDGSIGGVIVSPRDETPRNLNALLSDLEVSHANSERLVDPQFHIGAISPARPGKLVQHPHYVTRLTPLTFSPARIREFVDATLRWQRPMATSAFLSPTVMVDDLGSQWAQIAMMLAQESLDRHDGTKPLLISLVVGEDALRQTGQVDAWLDALTRLDADGFYLVVRRASEAYRQHYDPDVLASLLLTCYSLAHLNRYRLYVGYSDMVTLLLHAVGATATGSGWYTGLKQFTLRRFQPASGGRRPRDRYSSQPLLNSIYITELGGLYNAGYVGNILSATPYDGVYNGAVNPENVDMPREETALHHWSVLNGIINSLTSGTVGNRLDSATRIIQQARALYTQIGGSIALTPETGPTHLDQWLDALNTFRSNASV